MRPTLVVLPVAVAAALAAGAFATAAEAQKRRGPSVCDVDYLPLQEGNTWTYQPVNPAPAGPPASNLKLEVAKIETSDGATKVTFNETYRETTFVVEARCENGGLAVPPSSFLFAAEPGGAVLTELENAVHKGSSFPSGKRLTAGTQWFEEVKADVIRQPAEGTGAEHPPARVEVERLATVGNVEPIETGLGRYRATRLRFELRGRGKIGETTQEIPVREEGALWFADNVGIVRARDVSGNEWELVDSSLVTKK